MTATETFAESPSYPLPTFEPFAVFHIEPPTADGRARLVGRTIRGSLVLIGEYTCVADAADDMATMAMLATGEDEPGELSGASTTGANLVRRIDPLRLADEYLAQRADARAAAAAASARETLAAVVATAGGFISTLVAASVVLL